MTDALVTGGGVPSMRSAADYRREGMADAVVAIVAHRVLRVNVEELSRACGLQQPEVKAAIARLRDRHKRPRRQRVAKGPTQSGDLPCTHEGCGASLATLKGLKAHLRSHETVSCPFCGRTVVRNGLGPHKAHCDRRPVEAVADGS